jgi:hypothetical protein
MDVARQSNLYHRGAISRFATGRNEADAMLVTLLTVLFRSYRVLAALIVIGGATASNFSWVRTVPNCVTSNSGTAYYTGKDDSALACWPAGTTRDTLRQRAFEDWARESQRDD